MDGIVLGKVIAEAYTKSYSGGSHEIPRLLYPYGLFKS